jgi:hypothetical protein
MFEARSDPSSNEFSPIFLQFLECVEVVRGQNPEKFEFNHLYLPALADVFHGKWSTSFAHNCERERTQIRTLNGEGLGFVGALAGGLGVAEILDTTDYCTNPTFAAAAPRPPQQCVDLSRPRVALQAIPVWSELYLRHNEIASY